MTKIVVQQAVQETLRSMLETVLRQGDAFLGVYEVCRRTTLSRSALYDLEQAGGFPARRQLSANKIGWLQSEVSEWIASRPTVDAAREEREATRS